MDGNGFVYASQQFCVFSPMLRLYSALITFRPAQMDFKCIKSHPAPKQTKKANKLIQDVQLGDQLHAD